jgi:hydrogenase maturation protease
MTRLDAPRGVGTVVIAGLGSEHRHDDGVGPIVSEQAARVSGARCVGPVVDPLDLLGRWDDADLAVVVDAIHSGSEPGTIRVMPLVPPDGRAGARPAASRRHDPSAQPTGRERATSSHGVDVVGVHRLATAVGRAPARVVVVGIEGEDFSPGIGLSPRVEAAVPRAVHEVVTLVGEATSCA